MKRRLFGLLALLLTLTATTDARAFCRLTTEAPLVRGCQMDGMPLFWTQRCIPLSIDYRGVETIDMADVEEATLRAFSAWTSVECEGDTVGFQVETTGNSTCLEAQFNTESGNVNTLAFVDDWPERGYDPSAFALTTTWFNTATGLILDADIQLNTLRADYRVCADEGCDNPSETVDLENTLTHEAGHFFGLAHSEAPNSTMLATATDGETIKRDLAPDDIAGFCEAYQGAILSEACSFSARNGLDLDCETPEGCGCTVPGIRTGGGGSFLSGLLLVIAIVWRRRGRTRQ